MPRRDEGDKSNEKRDSADNGLRRRPLVVTLGLGFGMGMGIAVLFVLQGAVGFLASSFHF